MSKEISKNECDCNNGYFVPRNIINKWIAVFSHHLIFKFLQSEHMIRVTNTKSYVFNLYFLHIKIESLPLLRKIYIILINLLAKS